MPRQRNRPSGSRRKKKGPNGKPQKMKMSTIMLSLLALVGCIFSIGVLLGALALNGDDTGKHSYRSKTYKNEDVYQDGPDPALGIGRTIPTLPGAQEHGVQPPTVVRPPPPPTQHRDLNNVAVVTRPPTTAAPPIPPVAPKQTLLSSKTIALSPTSPPATVATATANPSLPVGKVNRDYSLRLDGENWMDIMNPLDLSNDGTVGELSVTAWIWLDPKDKGNNMKTIFANRVAGCDINAERYGFAFYVNSWQTEDRVLKLDVGTGSEGCNSLTTKKNVVPYGKWTHVGIVMQKQPNDPAMTTVMLTVNGEILASKSMQRGKTRSNQHLRLGAHVDGQAPFVGNISEFSVWDRTIIDPNSNNRKLDNKFYSHIGGPTPPLPTNGLRAYFPLDWSKAASKTDLLVAKDYSTHDYKSRVILPQRRRARMSNGGSALNNVDLSHLAADVAKDMNWGPSILAAGTYPDHVDEKFMKASALIAPKRAEAVKNAMRHCWNGYKQHAWGYDELKPQSGRGQNNWGGMGVTLLDSLDTLWLMGMHDEFDEATEWIKQHLNFNIGKTVSTFETTIRSLGGLLTAYDLSGKQIFLTKAMDLGKRLYRAFDTPSGIPVGQINLATGSGHNAAWTSSSSVLAEIGTLQVEFRYLAEVSGQPEMFKKVTKVFQTVKQNNRMADGLAPIYVSPQSGKFTTGRVTFGALGDSWYEYLLKCWLQGGKTEDWLREMYDNAMTGMANKLLKRTSRSNLAYVSDWDGGRNVHKMDHLVCFLPGILALGAYSKPDSPNRDRDMMLAKSLMYTCYQMYERTNTGIAAEYYEYPGGGDPKPASRAPFYILRPETAESLFVLHQLTGNPIYRDWSFNMFSAIEKYCKTQYGYGAWPDVRQTGRRPDDRMESFWLGETLKYFYLVQVPMEEHGIDLTKYVFNTEAHPTRTLTEVRKAIKEAASKASNGRL